MLRELRVKWQHQLMYGLRMRIFKRRDLHHRGVNDAKGAIKHSGLWGQGLLKSPVRGCSGILEKHGIYLFPSDQGSQS